MMERQARSQTASRKTFTDDQRMSANPELESTSNCVEPSSPHGEIAKLTNTCANVNMELCNWLHGLMMPETPDRYYAVCSRIICNKEHQRLDWTCLCATASVGAIPKSCFSVGTVSLSLSEQLPGPQAQVPAGRVGQSLGVWYPLQIAG
jgi:hypothetical protein